MEFGTIFLEPKTMTYFRYIMYRNDLQVHLLENLKMRNLKRNYNLYLEITEDDLQKNYIMDIPNILKFFNEDELKELEKIQINQKLYIKRDLLQCQLDCMIKNNKSDEHIKSHQRAIKRQNNKILGYEERMQKEKQKIWDIYNILKNELYQL